MTNSREMPTLDEVELPMKGTDVRFSVGGDLFWLRGTNDSSWQLEEPGRLLLQFRKIPATGFYQSVDDHGLGEPCESWRALVRSAL